MAGNTGWVTCTGSGSQNLSGGSTVTVLDFNVEITSVTSAKVRVPGSALGARYQFAGSWGLSQNLTDSSGSTVPQIAFARIIAYKVETNTYLLNIPAEKFWWVLPPGITVKIFIDW
jgi:hypothetical protein